MKRYVPPLFIAGLVTVAAMVFLCHPGAALRNGISGAIYGQIQSTLSELRAHGFKAATVFNNPRQTDFEGVKPEHLTQTVHASGSWTAPADIAAGDTLPVEVSAVEVIDGSRWVRVSIDGKPVSLDVTEWWAAESQQIQRRWTAHVELTDRLQLGLGVGYRIWEPWGIAVSPAVTVGVNGQWAAAELRLSRRIWSGVSIGAGGGWRIGDGAGLHLSAGVSVEL